MNYNADQVGRHTLYFVVNNQPSNVVVVDVFAQAPAGRNYYTPNGLTTTTSNGLTTTTSNGLTTTTSNGQTAITDTINVKPGNAEGHTGAPGQN